MCKWSDNALHSPLQSEPFSAFIKTLSACGTFNEVITTLNFSPQAMGASLDKYPRLQAWFDRCKKTFPDYEEANGNGAEMLGQFFKSKLTKGF